MRAFFFLLFAVGGLCLRCPMVGRYAMLGLQKYFKPRNTLYTLPSERASEQVRRTEPWTRNDEHQWAGGGDDREQLVAEVTDEKHVRPRGALPVDVLRKNALGGIACLLGSGKREAGPVESLGLGPRADSGRKKQSITTSFDY